MVSLLLVAGAAGCELVSGIAGLGVGGGQGPVDAAIDSSRPADATVDAGKDPARDGGSVEAPSDAGAPDAADAPACVTACDGGCVDVTSDPVNCGACGHDCMGAGCANAICQPTLLATVNLGAGTVGMAGAIAVDAVNVYFLAGTASGATPYVCPKSGCGAPAPVVNATLWPYAIAADGTFVYVVDSVQQRVLACTAGGCATLGVGKSIDSLAVDDGGVYWADFAYGEVEAGLVGSFRGDAGSALATGQTAPLQVTASGGVVSWVDSVPRCSGSSPQLPSSVVTFCLGCSAGPSVLATDPATFFGSVMTGCAASGPFVFWAESSCPIPSPTVTIKGCPYSGCDSLQADIVSIDAGYVAGMVADDAGLYFSTGDRIFAVPLQNGAPGDAGANVLVSGRQMNFIARDDSSIYWDDCGDAGCGSGQVYVWRVAK